MIKKNQKNIFIIVVLLVVIGLIVVFSAKDHKKNQIKHENNDNIEIIVKDNPAGMQESNSDPQGGGSHMIEDMGAATVDEITGKQPNMDGQPTNTDEMLKDKEIEI